MTPDVIRVTPLPEFYLEAEFTTGEIRRFDLKPYLGFPAFSSLRRNGLFMRAHVAHGTMAWSDEMDLSPDTLYLQGVVIQ